MFSSENIDYSAILFSDTLVLMLKINRNYWNANLFKYLTVLELNVWLTILLVIGLMTVLQFCMCSTGVQLGDNGTVTWRYFSHTTVLLNIIGIAVGKCAWKKVTFTIYVSLVFTFFLLPKIQSRVT